MPQKVLAGRTSDVGAAQTPADDENSGENPEEEGLLPHSPRDSSRLAADRARALVQPRTTAAPLWARVDQVILARAPERSLSEALFSDTQRFAVETALAYRGACLELGAPSRPDSDARALERALLQRGAWLGKPGVGFPCAVHLERFACPARLALTDDPRLLALGGIGMLTLMASGRQLGEVLGSGQILVTPPSGVQILLNGKLGPFVSARDALLELLRQGLADTVARIEADRRQPVVLEFTGPSARLLSVPERAVLCSIANLVGAAGALFVSDERTEAYLRDQRRSKAHRSLIPDAGAVTEEVVALDLSRIEPLVFTPEGTVARVRELEGLPLAQVVLGGDLGGARDLSVAAALLKSKRLASHVELLLAAPSRQVLEVLAQDGALLDLLTAGARLLEPDVRLLQGQLHGAPDSGASLRGFDDFTAGKRRWHVASVETLASSLITGTLTDPRALKRAPRVSIPRSWPTEDTLLMRPGKGNDSPLDTAAPFQPARVESPPKPQWVTGRACVLEVQHWQAADTTEPALTPSNPDAATLTKQEPAVAGYAVVMPEDAICSPSTLTYSLSTRTLALFATHFSLAVLSILAGDGIAAIQVSRDTLTQLRQAPRVTVTLLQLHTNDAPSAVTRDVLAAWVELDVAGVPLAARWLGQQTDREAVLMAGPVKAPPLGGNVHTSLAID